MHHPEEEEDYDYESLGNNTTMLQNAFAGALAGIAEHCAMYPVDSIKTRMQVVSSAVSSAGSTNVVSAAMKSATTSSTIPISTPSTMTNPTTVTSTAAAAATRTGQKTYLRHLWKGVNSVVLGAGPAHALHFATYEFCKERFVSAPIFTSNNDNNDNIDSNSSSSSNQHHPFAFAAAGACATLAHDFLMNPFDVVKQRMQLQGSSYSSIFECARKVFYKEGLVAFYISLPTTLVMSIPFQSIQFATYEFFRKTLLQQSSNSSAASVSTATTPQRSHSNYNPKNHIIAGGLAGAVASSVTTPLDVIKTLLQTRGTSTDPIVRNVNGFVDGAKLIKARYGLKGFFRGYKPRVLTHMPSAAISWSVYEYIKWMINTQNNQQLQQQQKDENFVSL